MTRVCLLGDPDVNLRYELLSRETARRALATYDLREPYENTVAVETVSLGAAVSLLNDLNWYIVRFVDDVIVLEPSVSETEWLSRDLATEIRDDALDPAASERFLKVYGVEQPDTSDALGTDAGDGAPEEQATGGDPADDEAVADASEDDAATDAEDQQPSDSTDPPRLVEPMYVTRTGQTIPEYDLRDVDETLRVRVTEAEFGA